MTKDQVQFLYVVSFGMLGIALAGAIQYSPAWIIPDLAMLGVTTWCAMRWIRNHRSG